MGHNYAPAIAGTDLKTVVGVQEAIFMKYSSGEKRGNNLILPFSHGELSVPDKYFSATDVLLQVYLPFDTTAEARQALSDIALLLSSQTEVAVTQTDPALGDIRAMVELTQDPVPTSNQFVYLFSLKNAKGFWEDVSPTVVGSGSPPAITTGGDRPIDDMVLTFSGVGYLEHTDPIGQVTRVEVLAGGPGGSYTLDVGARSIQNGGVDQDEFFDHTQPWIMKWEPDSTLSLAGNVGVSASYRNKYA